MARYVLINSDNIVVNMAEAESDWTPPSGITKVRSDLLCNKGWVYDPSDESFTEPE